MTMELTEDGFPFQPKRESEKSWTEAELLKGMTPYLAHADELPALLSQEYPD